MAADYKYAYDGMTRDRMMEKMRQGWKSGNNETKCGSGSTWQSTKLIRSHLPEIVQRYGIRTIADAGAGDLKWITKIDLDVEYRPFDLVPRHPLVAQADITKDVLPESDLILCRHVLNHLSVKLAQDALERFRESGSRYVLMTNCENQIKYWDAFGLRAPEPIAKFDDVSKWWLELYENRLH